MSCELELGGGIGTLPLSGGSPPPPQPATSRVLNRQTGMSRLIIGVKIFRVVFSGFMHRNAQRMYGLLNID